jgi:hypothetical protein
MAGDLLHRLFGGGNITAALDRELAGERILFESEPTRSVKTFSGRVPGLRSAGSKNWFRGAFAVTDRRVVAFGRGAKIVDVGYDMQTDGPARLTLASDGLHVVWDMDRVHPACRGQMELHVKAEVPEVAMAQFPVTSLSFDVDPAKVVRFAGSLKKLPAHSG